MTPHQINVLNEIRSVLRESYTEYLACGDPCTKSSDGQIRVKYPPFWHDGWQEPEAYSIEIYSYALGPSRNHTWTKGEGKDTYYDKYGDDPFSMALADVKEWQREMRADLTEDDDETR